MKTTTLKPEKNSGLKMIRTYDLCDTGAVLYQLSYQAVSWSRCEFRKSQRTTRPALNWLDSSVDRTLYRYRRAHWLACEQAPEEDGKNYRERETE